MDLTSLNQPFAARPDGYDNPHVETRVEFDENNRPVYVAVPVGPDRTMVHATTPEYGYREPTIYQPAYQPVQYASRPAYSLIHDPIVCRLLAGTVAVAGCAFALSFVLAAIAAATTALGILLGITALIWMISSSSGGAGNDVTVNITNSNKSKHRN